MFRMILDVSCSALEVVNENINENLKEYNPAGVFWITLGSVLFIQNALKLHHIYKHNDFNQVKDRVTDYAVLKVLSVPVIGKHVEAYINSQVHEALDSLKAEIEAFDQGLPNLPLTLPMHGSTSDEILATFDSLPSNKNDYKKSGAVYVHIDKTLEKLLGKVSVLTNYTNPMHDHWLFLNRLQGRVVRMCKDLFHGPEGTYGIITHGGTTSILEACKSYVLYARKILFISNPEIIVPESAHPAFDKAALILNATLRVARVNPSTGQVDINAMAALINNNTCMLVGSAVSYPYGQFDNITAIGQLGLKYNKPVHVDACLGGFLNVFAEEAGTQLPPWDFKVPGVLSISADIHKYGYGPKGSSLVFFHPACKTSPTYTNLTSSCGMYVTEGIDGSRSGQPIAEAYTTLMYFGQQYYIEEAKKIFMTRRSLVEQLSEIPDIQVMYDHQHSVVGIQSKRKINLAIVAEQFQKRGWSVNGLPAASGMAFHFCITSVHSNEPCFIPSFLQDIQAAVNYANNNPQAKASGLIKAYGQLSTRFAPVYVKNLIGDFFSKIRTMSGPIPGYDSTRPLTNDDTLEAPRPK